MTERHFAPLPYEGSKGGGCVLASPTTYVCVLAIWQVHRFQRLLTPLHRLVGLEFDRILGLVLSTGRGRGTLLTTFMLTRSRTPSVVFTGQRAPSWQLRPKAVCLARETQHGSADAISTIRETPPHTPSNAGGACMQVQQRFIPSMAMPDMYLHPPASTVKMLFLGSIRSKDIDCFVNIGHQPPSRSSLPCKQGT